MYNNQNVIMGYGQPPQAAPKVSVILTPEQINNLRNNGANFEFGMTEEDLIKGCCVHKDAQGRHQLVHHGDGTSTCSICKKTFRIVDELSEVDVTNAIAQMNNIVETIKLLYVSIPVQAARDIYPITEILSKFPKIYKFAMDSYGKMESQFAYVQPQNGMNAYNTFNFLTGGMGGYQQPMYPQQPVQMQQTVDAYGNVVYAQQPQMVDPAQQQQMVYAAPQGAVYNPMLQPQQGQQAVYTQQPQQPVYAQQGQQVVYAQQPVYAQPVQQPVPPQAAQAPQASGEIKTTTTLNV